MTGIAFIFISKYIEIGKIVIPAKSEAAAKNTSPLAQTQASSTKSK